jgi:hypothetical protein
MASRVSPWGNLVTPPSLIHAVPPPSRRAGAKDIAEDGNTHEGRPHHVEGKAQLEEEAAPGGRGNAGHIVIRAHGISPLWVDSVAPARDDAGR